MILKEILDVINMYADERSALEWDNSGLQIGDPMSEVYSVTVCLDVTDRVVQEAIDSASQLIISHHPLLFHGAKTICDDVKGRLIKKIIRNNINVYSTHTCFDMCGYSMNAYSAFRLGIDTDCFLEPHGDEGIGVCGDLAQQYTLGELCELVKKTFGAKSLRVSSCADDTRTVRRAAFCSGAGRDLIASAKNSGADVYITSDVSNSGFIEAMELDLPVVALTHYESEKSFIRIVSDILRKEIPSLEVRESSQGDLERFV